MAARVKLFTIIIALYIILPATVFCQSENFSPQERLQGYAQRGDSTYFIFDSELYRVKPAKVMIEGEMRGWNHDMNVSDWWLKQNPADPQLWTLAVFNPGFRRIEPGAAFKFRIDQGKWLDPPVMAPNRKGGNLILFHDRKRMAVRAEIVANDDIRLFFPEARPQRYIYSPRRYHLRTTNGDSIAVARVLYLGPGELQLVPQKTLNIRQVYYVHNPYVPRFVTARFDGWFKHLWSGEKLGANYSADKNITTIRIFIPRADSVFVHLYKHPQREEKYRKALKRDAHGVWEINLPGNWIGWYYDFTAYGPYEPGAFFSSGQNQIHFTDPYGRVSVDSFGPCRLWPEMKPPEPVAGGTPKMQDVIAYEVHVQDFTRRLPLPDSLKGTFKGFVTPGLRNAHGQKIGFDHLLELGVNVVHLMPVQEFLHYPDNAWQKAFKDDPYMIAQGVNLENYQWGYRTSHAFALESRYRVKGSTWGAQNEQFRNLVQAFHEKGIAVVVDVVFNHTAERMDGRQFFFNFLAMDAPYFYRMDEQFNFLGPYGTETKSELRPMVQRWIIEQCTDLIRQYGVDGFRIDLAGLTDKQTLLMLRQAVGPDILLYGEPWIDSADPEFEANPEWNWYKEDAPITFFQDDARNAFKGPPSEPKDKRTDRGYAGGNGDRESVKKALSAGFPSDKTPISGINYLDIHDNWALADRFARNNWDGRYGVDEPAFRIAATLLFTSLGPVVIHGGTELMRSKGAAPDSEVVKYLNGKPLYFHGKKDSYNLAAANAFVWENKGLNIGDQPGVYCNYRDMFDFWRGLIALRRSPHGRVFRIVEKPAPDYYRWIEPQNKRLLGYFVNNQILVLLNTDNQKGVFEHVRLPEGEWKLIAQNGRFNLRDGIAGHPLFWLQGASEFSVELEGGGILIWIKEK